jgi:hypothetical protein
MFKPQSFFRPVTLAVAIFLVLPIDSFSISASETEKTSDSQNPAAEQAFVQGPVDLAVDSVRMYNDLFVNREAELDIVIENEADAEARDAKIVLVCEDGYSDQQVVTFGPLERKSLKFYWTPISPGKQKIHILVITPFDTDQTNNQQWETVEVRKESFVDPKVISVKVTPGQVLAGNMVNIEATLENDSDVEVREVSVVLNAEDGFKDLKRVSLKPKATESVVFSWVPREPGTKNVSVAIECAEDVELNNNEVKVPVEVKGLESSQAQETPK